MWLCGCFFCFPDPLCVPVSPVRRLFRMDQCRAKLESTSLVKLYGEFTGTSNRKGRCAVILTEKDLVVQRLTSAPVGRNKVVLSLKDCVGCRAYRGNDSADKAAYLVAYFYPLKRRWMSSRVSRQRVEQGFRLASLQDPQANLEEAEKWARAVRERSARQQFPRNGECWIATTAESLQVVIEAGSNAAITFISVWVHHCDTEANMSFSRHQMTVNPHLCSLVKEKG